MIGHNNPPTEAEILIDWLKLNNLAILEEFENIKIEKDFLPDQVKNDNEAVRVTDFIKRVNECNKNIEGSRKQNKEPYLQAGKTVDTFFGQYKNNLDAISSDIKKPLLKFQQEKAAEQERLAKIEAEKLRKEAEKAMLEASVQEAVGSCMADEHLKEAIKIEKQADKIENVVGIGAVKSQTASSSIRKRIVGEVVDLDKLDIIKLKKYFTEESIQKAINAFISDGGRECEGVSIYEKQDVVIR